MLRTVLLLLLAHTASPGPASVAIRRDEALKKLLEVFGMEDPPAPPTHSKQPPQYMVDLFNSVANADGVTKNPDILEGNTVRSFLEKTHSEEMRFLFVLSSVAKNEKILTAELHLFRLWPRVKDITDGPKRQHFCQFASGRGHHESKKPMLVLFTDDGRRGASLPTAGFPDVKLALSLAVRLRLSPPAGSVWAGDRL
ncbi:hypothetical protein EK904_009329 [Melospiza melodia maxima]|nr:hypothetical protein EK904_009329 [Melospiza melodia maxima]